MRRFARGVTRDYPPPTSDLACTQFYDLFNKAEKAIISFEPESIRDESSKGYHKALSYIAAHEPDATSRTFWDDKDIPDNQSDLRARRRFAINMQLFNIPLFLHDCYQNTQKRQMLDRFMRSYHHYANKHFFPPFAPADHEQLEAHMRGQRSFPHEVRSLGQYILWWSSLVQGHGNPLSLGSTIKNHYDQITSQLTMEEMPQGVISREDWYAQLLHLKMGTKAINFLAARNMLQAKQNRPLLSLLPFLIDRPTRECMIAAHGVFENLTPVHSMANVYQYGQGEGLRREHLKKLEIKIQKLRQSSPSV